MDRGRVIKRNALIIVGNVFSEVHTPCTLKTSLVDVEKEYMLMLASTVDYFYRPLPNSPYLTISTFLHPVVWRWSHVLFTLFVLIKDEVILTVGCTIFPPMYLFIAKYLFTGS
jgi:hypothetical protein